jgi:hypothetical protein
MIPQTDATPTNIHNDLYKSQKKFVYFLSDTIRVTSKMDVKSILNTKLTSVIAGYKQIKNVLTCKTGLSR